MKTLQILLTSLAVLATAVAVFRFLPEPQGAPIEVTHQQSKPAPLVQTTLIPAPPTEAAPVAKPAPQPKLPAPKVVTAPAPVQEIVPAFTQVSMPVPAPMPPMAVTVAPAPPPQVLAPAPPPPVNNDEYNGYAALELAQNMEGMERIQMVRQGIGLLANFNVDQAVDAANSLPNQHDHGVAVGTIVRLVNEKNPPQAARILFKQVPPETALALIQYPRTAAAMRQVVDQQVRTDPAAAINWTSSMADAGMQKAALNVVSQSWAQADSNAALSWANSLPEGSGRAEALQQMLEITARATPPDTWVPPAGLRATISKEFGRGDR